MSSRKVLDVSKIWFRFSRTDKNGQKLHFRWEQLPGHRFEEFLDFKMKYFVKHALFYVTAGIYKNPIAMTEMRQILTKKYKDPLYNNAICCVDDETNKIVAFDSMILCRRGEILRDIEPVSAQTAEVKKLLKMIHERYNLCPVPKIMAKFGVEKYFDDRNLAVHSDFRGYQITPEAGELRRRVCKVHGVPLTGAWMTSAVVQKSSERDDWETIYEIGYQELEKILEVKFHNPPPMIKYMVKKFD